MGSGAAATVGVSELAVVGSPGELQAASTRRPPASREKVAARTGGGGGLEGIQGRGYPVPGPGAERGTPTGRTPHDRVVLHNPRGMRKQLPGWCRSRPHATMQRDALAREHRPPVGTARRWRAAGKDPEFGVVRLSAGTSAFSVIRAAAWYTPFAALRAAVPGPTGRTAQRSAFQAGGVTSWDEDGAETRTIPVVGSTRLRAPAAQ